ncbi:hypothetical protein RHMOL_Rhmol05G0080300 [Rhododendron molle]|uniref:Uncharacterized protein n=2 Tax=Rhododendron molle TaxID=49168 RepID=A0ACC0NLW5_RHOML|nr:hypothetical protein RHMOL_Rhmol05G0080300 [Rhododendron molle]KAI8554200.1 hypothetical protein RHMOL_Rhmol05G0080300 [Rhododendron molle]
MRLRKTLIRVLLGGVGMVAIPLPPPPPPSLLSSIPPLFHSSLKDFCPSCHFLPFHRPSILSPIFDGISRRCTGCVNLDLVAWLCSEGYDHVLFSPFDVVSTLFGWPLVPSFHFQPFWGGKIGMGIMREKRGSSSSSSSTSPCAHLRTAYHNCFNRWYSEKFVKGNWDKQECTSEWKKYRDCLAQHLEDKHLSRFLEAEAVGDFADEANSKSPDGVSK